MLIFWGKILIVKKDNIDARFVGMGFDLMGEEDFFFLVWRSFLIFI